MPYGVIYRITNLINGKIYIGQTTQSPPYHRWHKHCSSNDISMPIVCAIRKYGRDNFVFEVISKSYSRNGLNKNEAKWIKYFNSNDKQHGYNIGIIVNNRIGVAESTCAKRSQFMKVIAQRPDYKKRCKRLGQSKRGIKKMDSSSRFLGVYFEKSKQKWRAKLCVNSKNKSLGYFKSEIEAAQAYDLAAHKYYGPECKLNFPNI